MFDFLWNASQEVKITNAKNVAIDSSSRVSHVSLDLHFLSRTVEKMAITNAALIEILTEHIGITEGEILNKILEIDMRDGVQDGKITNTPKTCKACARVLPAKRRVCLYCGEPA
jgi:hypothetical protein